MSSFLGKFLQLIRKRKNLSQEIVEYRLRNTKVDLVKAETNPEKMAGKQLTQVFKAIELQKEELNEFCTIAKLEFGEKKIKTLTESVTKDFDFNSNIIDFSDKNGLENIRKNRKTRKKRKLESS